MNLRERILQNATVYDAFRRTVIRDDYMRRVGPYLEIPEGGAALDVGCGLGDFAQLFPGPRRYVGIDHNAMYLRLASERVQAANVVFIAGDVTDPTVLSHGPYDLAFVVGVLHHLETDHAVKMLQQVSGALRPGGRFVALEPVFEPEQSLTARLIIASDRGRFVRDAEGYEAIVGAAFGRVESDLVRGLLRIPYSHVVVTGHLA